MESSCPRSSRASTSYSRENKDVDGRDKPGHDGVWFYLNTSCSSLAFKWSTVMKLR